MDKAPQRGTSIRAELNQPGSLTGIVIGGLITLIYWGYCGSFTLMIAHGLCSSGLFCLANITYERLGSPNIFRGI
jgi:NADH:ubiquinone oxidoreductase subunit 4 (chain M)